jgi:hypothetical protein
VAPSADRCRSCGGDPDLGPVDDAGVGETLSRSTERASRGARRGWRWAVVAGVAMVWVVLALTGGPDDEQADDADRASTTVGEATATTAWIEPTSTTAMVIPGGPLLGEPSGLHLVLVTDNSSRLIDVDSGAVTRLDVRVLGVADRHLVVRDLGVVAVWPPPFDGTGATTIATIPADRVVEQVWVVGDGSLVWLLQHSPPFEVGPAPATATLVDLGGRTLARLDLPYEFSAAGAIDRGLVVSGPGGVFVIGTDGAIERISTGVVRAVGDDRVVVYDCDERLQCGVEVLDGRGRRVDVGDLDLAAVDGAVAAPDGRIAAFAESSDPSGDRRQVTVDGVTMFESVGAEPTGGLAWSPDGRWLAFLASHGIHLIDTLGWRAPVVLPLPSAFIGYNLFSFT